MENSADALTIHRDSFVDYLATYSRKNLFAVYIAGLSVLTRYVNAPPPKVETILLINETERKKMIHDLCNDEYFLLKARPLENVYQCSIFNRTCHLSLKHYYNKTVISPIECIDYDVRLDAIHDPNNIYTPNLRERILPLHEDPEDSSVFWRSLSLISYLPGFRLNKFPDRNLDIICGTNMKSPLYRFQKEQAGLKTNLTYGALIVRDTLLNLLNNINFPLPDIFPLLPYILNVYAIPRFDNNLLNLSMNAFQHHIVNLPNCEFINRPAVRLAIMAMPIWEYCVLFPNYANQYINSFKYTSDYDDFFKMTSNRVSIDRNLILSWLFIGKMGLPSDIVFNASHICEAYYEIRNNEYSIDEWVYIDAGNLWQEALSLLDPSLYNKYLETINSSGVLNLLKTQPLDKSNNEIFKMFSISAISKKKRELKHELYQFLKDNPNSTLNEFKKFMSQKNRELFNKK